MKQSNTTVPLVTILLVLAVTGCEPAPIVAPNPEEVLLDSPDTDVPTSEILPEASTAPVLAYLETERFRERWNLWPGTDSRYPGSEPHGMQLTTYDNRLAQDGIEALNGTMPTGAMIVKDNFTSDGERTATTLMYKRDGENSDSNGWFWMKWQPDGTIDATGAAESCRSCHGMAAGNDSLLTGSISPPTGE
jgi:hypothetical protein